MTQFFTETKARVVTVGGTVGLFWVIELVDNLILRGGSINMVFIRMNCVVLRGSFLRHFFMGTLVI